MLDPAYLDVLRTIHARLRDGDVNWVVTGTAAFALQGVPTEVHDIDIQTDRSGAYEIERRFAQSLIESVAFSSTERIRSHFGALMVDGIRVEIMGDIQKRLEDGTWECPVDLGRLKTTVQAEGVVLPVLPVEYEQQAYLKLGRIEKAEMLRKWLLDRNQDAE